MKRHVTAGATLAAVLLAGSAFAAGDLDAGPKVGTFIAPFHPFNVTGRFAGQKQCLVWVNGDNPVAMVFAREVSGPLTSLVKKIDTATGKNRSCRMGSFVVFCSKEDKETLEKTLKDLADKEKLKNTVLTIDNPAGPKQMKITKDADVVVVLYKDKTVKEKYAFKKGELKEADVNKIIGDLSKILPEDK